MKNWGNVYDIKTSTLRIILLFGAFGCVSILFVSLSADDNRFQIFGSLFLLAIAFSILGALIGLLFGIPKSNNQVKKDSPIKKNTNLEEVSDWLTKMIIGFGISEVSSIDESIISLVSTIHDIDPELPKISILLVSVYFPVYGFIAGWLATRIYLPPIFADVDRKVEKLTDAKDDVPDNVNFDASDIDISTSLSTSEIIEGVNALKREGKSIDGSLYHKLGIILFSRREYEEAAQYFRNSYDLTKNLKSLTNIGVIYNQGFNNPQEAIGVFDRVLTIKNGFLLALYNKACALARLGKTNEAIDNLEIAIREGKNEYVEIAIKDSALLPLSEEPRFRELVPNYNPREDHISTLFMKQ